MDGTTRKELGAFVAVIVLLFAIAAFAAWVTAAPGATTATYNDTMGGPSSSPTSFNTSGATITTLVLNAEQQNTNWKGYVGNVTGTLTLDDPNGRTLYDWTITGTIQGEVYASRNSSASFTTVNCSNATTIVNEQTVLGMTSADSDSINTTFNETSHVSFLVGTRNMSSCPSTVMYLNDTRPAFTEATNFQEVLLQDSGLSMIYTALMEDNQMGFDNSSLYDFEMILAENGENATPTTYYFWVEIGT